MFKNLQLLILLCAFFSTAQAQWVTTEVSLARAGMGTTTTNGKVIFAGGYPDNSVADPEMYRKRVDIYDVSSDSWTTDELSVFRQFTFAVSVDTKVYFVGYTQTQADDQDVVEVYDTATETWEMLTLPNIFGATSVTTAMGSIYFVKGGLIDIYDTATGIWSTANLSTSRILAKAEACNGKVFFAGGGFSAGTIYALVDIYDIATDTWTTADLSEGRNLILTACVNDKVYFVGGSLGFSGYSSNVDVYDTNTDTWSVLTLNAEKQAYAVAATDNNLYVAGGFNNEEGEYTAEVEVFDGETDEKTTLELSLARAFLTATGTESQLFVGGGNTGNSDFYTTVDIYTEQPLSTAEVEVTQFNVFPNPTTDYLTINRVNGANFQPFVYRIFNAVGTLVQTGQTMQEIEVADLARGIYFMEIEEKEHARIRFVKQ